MASKNNKGTSLTTSKCTVLFASLGKPNTKFNKDGEYNVKVRLPKEEGEAILAKIVEVEDAAFEEAYNEALKESKKKANSVKRAENRPCVIETNDDDEPTGFYTLNVKMKASGEKKDGTRWSRKPALYDAKRNLLTNAESLIVYSGSEVRVAFTLTSYNAPIGVGVSANLDGVQIIKLATGGRSVEDMGFEDEDDGFVYTPSEEPVEKADGESGGEEDDGSEEF